MKPADNLFFAATLYPPFYPPQRAGYRWTGQDVKGHIPQYKKVDKDRHMSVSRINPYTSLTQILHRDLSSGRRGIRDGGNA